MEAGESGKAIYNELKNSDFGYRVRGYFDEEDNNEEDMPLYLGKVEEVKSYVLENQIDEIYCALDKNDNYIITDLIIFSEKNMIRFS